MAWVRIHDGAMSHPKIVALSAYQFKVWVWGLVHCQAHLTDGHISFNSISPTFRRALAALSQAGLWHIDPISRDVTVHDYLDWNDSREVVRERQRKARHRVLFFRDGDLKAALRKRDGNRCRYCGERVNWADRRGARGATYDHVDPKGEPVLSNLVIACRGCNSRKMNHRPEEVGMVLRPLENLDTNLGIVHTTISRLNQTKPSTTESKEHSLVRHKTPDARIKVFLTWFQAEYKRRRHGADYFVKWDKHSRIVQQLLGATELERLKKCAQVMLSEKCEEDFIVQTDRGIEILSAKFNWLSDRLAFWETRQRQEGAHAQQ